MRARFFYGEECYNTWPKLFVLTEDGKFHCEYLDYMKPARVNENFDFRTFKAEDYSWDGYQTIVEITEEEAKSTSLTRQGNWISRYLSTKISNMRQFKKGDSEYISNGHYNIDGVQFMSIWTFKNKNNFDRSENTNQINGHEAIEILGQGTSFHNSKPDFGGFSEIKLFPVNELREFYNQ